MNLEDKEKEQKDNNLTVPIIDRVENQTQVTVSQRTLESFLNESNNSAIKAEVERRKKEYNDYIDERRKKFKIKFENEETRKEKDELIRKFWSSEMETRKLEDKIEENNIRTMEETNK